MAKGTCSVDGCDNAEKARGWCSKHYDRWRHHGSPAGNGRTLFLGPADVRFWPRINKMESGCWEWTGTISESGYGQFWDGSRLVRPHRWVYEAVVGPIPDGLVIDHLCRNRACCNPAHLEPVTRRENSLRGVSPNAENARKTHCKRGHEFTPENTIRRADAPTRRQCRECKRIKDREYRRGAREAS